MEEEKRPMKYILVSGGVLSGIGKGVVASSTAMLLRSYGLRVTNIKIDPYLNIDAGTMSPFEHGEVYILDDGGEVDLDLGNYERFVDITLTKDNNITTGKVYQSVIDKERRGDYLGKTVQVVPHVCDAIQDWVQRVARVPADGTDESPDVCVIELGGTVGDIESMPFVEAMRQFQFRVGRNNMCIMHVSLVPVLGTVGEQKTKPTQQSVRELRAQGLSPNFIICRSSTILEDGTKQKLASFCHVNTNQVISVHDVSNLYRVPLLLVEQELPKNIFEVLNLEIKGEPNLKHWTHMADIMDQLNAETKGVRIVIAGKYTGLSDSYLSVIKGLHHASLHTGVKVFIDWIETVYLEPESKETDPESYEEAWATLKRADGILVPGAFGSRGVEGKILAAKYARENKIPYFGICLGLQVSVIEYARHVLGWTGANSEEFDTEEIEDPETKRKRHVVVFMPEISKSHMGGTMRLGGRSTIVKDADAKLPRLYKAIWNTDNAIDERHRHRYEVNPKVVEEIESHGLKFVGQDETGQRQEIVEIPDHPYYVGVQYHPEMKSRPSRASPPFVGLVLAANGELDAFLAGERKLNGLFID
eukprot:TRINITY_DN11658_c0_g1_i1.p1 TRINITY_DN11658_c0_g1~~TRINITY_DN11658_c0_g1_i1.p1  ORF type:complete len:601 (-),score=152.63 TRINITY_DN11658_c0_g1_i1:115-1878(-)